MLIVFPSIFVADIKIIYVYTLRDTFNLNLEQIVSIVLLSFLITFNMLFAAGS